MKQILTLLFMFGLALSGVEGAVDAVDVDHSGGGTGAHEEHYQHAGDAHAHDRGHGHGHTHGDSDSDGHRDDDGDGHPDQDSAGHAHYCHCGMHVPPMAFATIFSMQVMHDARPAFSKSLHTFLADPPLLRPPIA